MLLSEVRDRYHQTFKTVRAPDTRLLDFLASQSQELAEAFFLEYLQDAPKPRNLLSGAVVDPQRQQIVLGLPLSALEQASRVLNTSLHAFLMTAYGIALGEHRGNTDTVRQMLASESLRYSCPPEGVRCGTFRADRSSGRRRYCVGYV